MFDGLLLLMEESLHHGMSKTLYIMVDSPYQLVIAGFLNHQQCLNASSGFGDV